MALQKALIVDDSSTERYFLTDLLVKGGYSVSVSESGEGVISKIKAGKSDPILMDIVMQGQNGFQVTRSISRDLELQNIISLFVVAKALKQTASGVCVKAHVIIWLSRSIRRSC